MHTKILEVNLFVFAYRLFRICLQTVSYLPTDCFVFLYYIYIYVYTQRF